MDPEDLAPRAVTPLKALMSEDLSTLSLEELGERIEKLQAEIARIEQMIESKTASRAAAESVFKT